MDNIAFLVSKTSAVQLWLLGSKPKMYSDIVGMFDIYLIFFLSTHFAKLPSLALQVKILYFKLFNEITTADVFFSEDSLCNDDKSG